MVQDAAKTYWENATARLAARINFAAWIEKFAQAIFALNTAAAVALYALRRTGGPVAYLWIGLAIAFVLAAFVALRRARDNWHGVADARVLLESTLRLDARLSAAAVGVTTWPPVRGSLPAVVRWNSLATPSWLLAATALLVAGEWAPLPSARAATHFFTEKPPALAQTEAMIEELSKLNVADPASREQLAAEARELTARPVEEQYTHSALEAADALRDQTMEALNSLAHDYDSAASALAAPESRAAGAGASELKRADEQLAAALDGLRTGRLAGNRELTAALSAAQKSPSSLTPEQRKQLSNQLSTAGAQTHGIAGAAGAETRIAQPVPVKLAPGYGSGGVDRGRGDAPMTMNSQPAARQEGRMEGVAGTDLSRASLGDLLSVEAGGAPSVDPSATVAPGAGGTVSAPARGGEAVWIDRLTPADRAVLRELFK